MAIHDQPSVHDEALAANVEVVTGTLKELRRGLQLVSVDPEAGAKIVTAQADLLSKAIASLSMQIAHLHVPERNDDAPPLPVIDVEDAHEVALTLDAVLHEKVCTTCGMYI